ncbi:MAG: hypothetical protein WC641_08010 [Patescibacteria group bacterium]
MENNPFRYQPSQPKPRFEKIKKTVSIVAAAGLIAGCGDAKKFGSDEVYDSGTKSEQEPKGDYLLMFENYPGLKPYKDYLEKISFVTNKEGHETGLHLVLDVLENTYDADIGNVEEEFRLKERLAGVPVQHQVLIIRIVHALWVEKHQVVPWSLKDYSLEETAALLYDPYLAAENQVAVPKPSSQDAIYSSTPMEVYPEVQLELDASYKLYALAKKMASPNKNQILINSIRWIKSNNTHTYTDQDGTVWDWDRYSDGRPDSEKKFHLGTGFDIFIPRNLDRYFDERIGGCHEPVIVLAGLLRSLNIPAYNINYEGHGMTHIPGSHTYVHGDHMALMPATPSSLLLVDNTACKQGISSGDSMMVNVLNQKIDAAFPGEETIYFKGIHVLRKNDTLLLSLFNDKVSPIIFETIKSEAPQYSVNVEQGGVTGHPVKIKSLNELSGPSDDPWK